jgi:Na+/melibiose symporter-like transporter
MTANMDERNALFSIARVFHGAGTLLCTTLMTWLVGENVGMSFGLSSIIVCGIGVLGLAALHTVTLLLSKEKPADVGVDKTGVLDSAKGLLKDKNLFKIIFISVLWNVANYATTSFMGTYQIKELAFPMTLVSAISIVGSLARVLFSRPMGRFADKYSFSKMLVVCLSVCALSFAFAAFTVPENGKLFYFIHFVLHSVAMAGINSATINLIYDYVVPEQRVSALALQQTVAGFSGFFTVLIISPLVSLIQENGNSFLGLSVYAQQVTSTFSFVILIFTILYLIFVIGKLRRKGK